MNGPHDVGGAQGFGPLPLEADEPLFHAPWERQAFALTLAMGGTGAWNIDMSRSARERLAPARYLASSYYQIWFEGLLRLMAEGGLLSAAELAAVNGAAALPAAALPAATDPGLPPGLRLLTADRVAPALAAGSPTARHGATSAYAVGDRVRAKNMHPIGHTRLPRYVRGHIGVIESRHGAHVFPDRHAGDRAEAPQPLYTVRFDAQTLWGDDTTADCVLVDCWESYLEPVEPA